MKTFPDFENELKAIDPRISVAQNKNNAEIANIKLSGKDICPIPSGEIYDEDNPGYVATFSNGMTAAHRSRVNALAVVKNTIERVDNDKEYHDAFFGIGEYK